MRITLFLSILHKFDGLSLFSECLILSKTFLSLQRDTLNSAVPSASILSDISAELAQQLSFPAKFIGTCSYFFSICMFFFMHMSSGDIKTATLVFDLLLALESSVLVHYLRFFPFNLSCVFSSVTIP